MFPTPKILKIYHKYDVDYVTDTDSTLMFFVFLCDLNSCVSEDKARNIIFEVMLESKVFDRFDLSSQFYEQFDCRNEDLKKRVGLFEIKNIENANVLTTTLNPKEYYERFVDHSGNKKHKGLKKSTPGMILIHILAAYVI